MRRWWRENRLWLLALPLAAAAVIVTSSYNVRYFWYDGGLHHRVAAGESGETVEVSMDYDDALGPTTRSFSVALRGFDTVRDYPFDESPGPPPEGLDAVVAHLDWAAAEDQVLRACTVSLVDSKGRRYDTDMRFVTNPCTPEARGGPVDPLGPDQQRGQVPEGEDRPDTWSTDPVFLVPEGREITRVLVWWATPDYVELSAS